jgi:hypothetical protein
MKKTVIILMGLCLIQSTNNSYAIGVPVIASKVASSIAAVAMKAKGFVVNRILTEEVKEELEHVYCLALFVGSVLLVYISCKSIFTPEESDEEALLQDQSKNSAIEKQELIVASETK